MHILLRFLKNIPELDQKAKDADEGRLHISDIELEQIKKEKLLLKDEALHIDIRV